VNGGAGAVVRLAAAVVAVVLISTAIGARESLPDVRGHLRGLADRGLADAVAPAAAVLGQVAVAALVLAAGVAALWADKRRRAREGRPDGGVAGLVGDLARGAEGALARARAVLADGDPAEAQAILANLGLYDGDAHGLLDRRTTEALRRFQRLAELPETGRLDRATADLLAVVEAARARADAPGRAGGGPPDGIGPGAAT
jgi:hypothetical protein